MATLSWLIAISLIVVFLDFFLLRDAIKEGQGLKEFIPIGILVLAIFTTILGISITHLIIMSIK